MLTWAQKRQLVVSIIILAGAIFVLGGLFVFLFGGQGTNEEILRGNDFSILWSRFFKLREGFVDLAALIENPNDLSAGKFRYSFKIYDENNILITIKEGESYAGPKEKFVLFEPNVAVFQRTPSRLILDIENMFWEKTSTKEIPIIDVLGAEKFLEDIFPRLVLTVKNSSQKSYQNIETTVVLWNGEDEIVGASRTIISGLGIEEEKAVTYTWPEAITGVLRVEAFFRLP